MLCFTAPQLQWRADTWFLAPALTGYIQWMMVNIGDLFFLDVWLIQKKAKNRFVLPGTEGHPGYEFKAWMKDYALPGSICSSGRSCCARCWRRLRRDWDCYFKNYDTRRRADEI